MSSFILATAGWYSSRWPTMSLTPLGLAVAMRSSASAAFSAIGFSMKACLPASRTRLPSG